MTDQEFTDRLLGQYGTGRDVGSGRRVGSIINNPDMVLGDETSLVLGNKTGLKLDGTSRVGKTSDGTETFKQQDRTGREGGCSRAETRRGTGSMSLS